MGVILSIFMFLAFIAIFLLAFGLALVSRLLGGVGNLLKLFGFGKSDTQNSNRQYSSNNQHTANSRSSANRSSHTKTGNGKSPGKIFGNDEGTYVDFEEIK